MYIDHIYKGVEINKKDNKSEQVKVKKENKRIKKQKRSKKIQKKKTFENKYFKN